MPSLCFIVSRNKHVVEVAEGATVLEMKELLLLDNGIGINRGVDSNSLRLISAGKLLGDEQTIETLKLDKFSKITVLVGNAGAKVPTIPRHLQTRVLDDLGSGGGATRAIGQSQPPSLLKLSPKSRFREIQVLPGLPMQDRARAILVGFANSPGFIAVME